MRISLFTLILFIMSIHPLFSDTLHFSAERVQYEAAEGNEYTLLSGNVYIKTGSKEIKADEIRLYGEDHNILICKGNVEVKDSDKDFKINSESFYYDRKLKITRINDRSVMEDYKNEMIIKSGYMEYKEKEEILVLQIGVRILKEDLTCRCEFATYNKDLDKLVMTGRPVVHKDSDVFQASKIEILLETDEIIMDGKVDGKLILEDEEEEAGDSTPTGENIEGDNISHELEDEKDSSIIDDIIEKTNDEKESIDDNIE